MSASKKEKILMRFVKQQQTAALIIRTSFLQLINHFCFLNTICSRWLADCVFFSFFLKHSNCNLYQLTRFYFRKKKINSGLFDSYLLNSI